MLKFWEDFIEVACKKLEHRGFPGFTGQVRVQVSFFNCVFKHVFVEVISHELLKMTIDPKLLTIYIGLRGR